VSDRLQLADVRDAANRLSANLPHTFGEDVDRFQYGVRLLIKKQVQVVETAAGQMPVEVLSLHVQGECVCDQRVDRLRDRLDVLRTEICGRGELAAALVGTGGDSGHVRCSCSVDVAG